jgi:thiol-disulfide isomerase/thioredoxin
LPHLRNLYEKYAGEGLRVVLVDVRNMKDATSAMAQEASLSMPVMLDDKDVADTDYQVRYTPTTFIIGPEGKAVFKHVGFGQGHPEMLDKEIALLLKKHPGSELEN